MEDASLALDLLGNIIKRLKEAEPVGRIVATFDDRRPRVLPDASIKCQSLLISFFLIESVFIIIFLPLYTACKFIRGLTNKSSILIIKYLIFVFRNKTFIYSKLNFTFHFSAKQGSIFRH